MNNMITLNLERDSRHVPAFKKSGFAAAGLLLLGACQTAGGQGVSNFDVFSTPQKIVAGEDVVLPRSSAALSKKRWSWFDAPGCR